MLACRHLFVFGTFRQVRPETRGRPSKFIIWRPLKSIFFKLFCWPVTGLEKLVGGRVPKLWIISGEIQPSVEGNRIADYPKHVQGGAKRAYVFYISAYDFFLWGYLKSKVFVRKLRTVYSRRSESFHSRRNYNCATRNVSKCDAEL